MSFYSFYFLAFLREGDRESERLLDSLLDSFVVHLLSSLMWHAISSSTRGDNDKVGTVTFTTPSNMEVAVFVALDGRFSTSGVLDSRCIRVSLIDNFRVEISYLPVIRILRLLIQL